LKCPCFSANLSPSCIDRGGVDPGLSKRSQFVLFHECQAMPIDDAPVLAQPTFSLGRCGVCGEMTEVSGDPPGALDSALALEPKFKCEDCAEREAG
jgi:hypothetical protein